MEATEPERRRLRLRRPFGWGVVIVTDRASGEIPEGLNELGFATSPTGLAFRVRHAQDVELGAQRRVRRFVDLRGEDLVGSVVLRCFEHRKLLDAVAQHHYEAGEFRTWWVSGGHVLTTPTPTILTCRSVQ